MQADKKEKMWEKDQAQDILGDSEEPSRQPADEVCLEPCMYRLKWWTAIYRASYVSNNSACLEDVYTE